MAQKVNNADFGWDDTVVTTANSGGSNGDAFNLIAVNGTNTIKFQQGTYEFTSAGGSFQAATARWDLTGNLQAGRFEIYLSSITAGNALGLIQVAVAGSERFNFRINSSNHFEIRHNYNLSSSAQIVTDSGVVPTVGSWFRVEYSIDFTTGGGLYDVRIYPDRTSTTPTYTFSGTSTNIQNGVPTVTWLGAVSAPGATVLRMDNLAINNTGVFIGPVPDTPGDIDAAPVSAGVSLPPATAPASPPVNDLRVNATEVVIPTNGATWNSVPTSNDDLTRNTVGGTDDVTTFYFRTAWWRYRPLTSGTCSFTCNEAFTVYFLSGGTLTVVGSRAAGVPFSGTFGVADYYIVVGSPSDTSGLTYQLNITGRATAVPAGNVDAVPISADVSLPAAPDWQVDAAPISSTVSMSGSASTPPVLVAPITAGASVRAGDIRRLRYGLLEPLDDTTIPVVRPTFAAVVTIMEGNLDEVGVDFQYGVDLNVSPTTISTTVQLLDNANVVEATAPADLDAGETYQWRMRLVVDGEERDWTDPWTFTVSAVTSAASVPITCTVVSTATYPHLWLLDPAAGSPGDHVTVIGHGFPITETGVLFGDDEIDIVSWEHIDATANATTADRFIGEDLVDPEHDEIVIVVPDTLEPGSSITVKGTDD